MGRDQGFKSMCCWLRVLWWQGWVWGEVLLRGWEETDGWRKEGRGAERYRELGLPKEKGLGVMVESKWKEADCQEGKNCAHTAS